MKKTLAPYYSEFQDVANAVKAFKPAGSWIARVAYFPDEKTPKGVGIQLSRPNWFNEEGMGIHFETWITEKEIQSKKLKFVLHILHQDFFPDTQKKPWDLIFPLVEDKAILDHVAAWKGFKMGRTVPIKGEKRYSESLHDTVLGELSHFLPIGDRIDILLKNILKF